MQSKESRQVARVLIVEQDEAVARICLKALGSERFDTRTASCTTEAWQTIASWRPQLYIVGDDFPECMGLEFCGQLRAKTNAPILSLTSSDSVGLQVNVLEAGADDVMVRPVAGPLLLAKANSLMRRAYRYSIPPKAPQAPSATPNGAQASIAPSNPAQVATVSNAPQPAGAPAGSVTAAPRRGITLSTISTAPVTPEALAPETNFQSWPRCEACGYMGPNERFEVTDSTGTTIRACPACNAVGRMRVPKRS